MKHPSYVLQMGGYDSYHAHKFNQMGFLDDIKSWGQEQIDKYIDEPLRDLGTSVGLTQEEIDRIAAETNKAYEKELKKKQQELIASITGQTQQTQTGPSYTQQIEEQLRQARNQLANMVGGQENLKMIGLGLFGVIVVYGGYKVLAGPK